MRLSSRISSFFVNVVLLFFSASFIFPVIWLFYSSVKSQREFAASIIGLPRSITFEHYINVLATGRIPAYILNTVRNTVIAVAAIILFGFIIGYFLARFSFKGRHFVYVLFVLGMLMPIHAIVVPTYILYLNFGLVNRWFTLLFPYISFGLPIAVFLVESYVRGLPTELEEAAAIDGSSFIRTLFRIVMPLTMPILITVGIIQFFATWNEFFFALILLNDESLFTIPVGLARMQGGQFTANYPRLMATMVIAIIIPMAIYFIFSKRIIQGMVAGAVKG